MTEWSIGKKVAAASIATGGTFGGTLALQTAMPSLDPFGNNASSNQVTTRTNFNAHTEMDDATFTATIYTRILQRAPDPGGLSYWTGIVGGQNLGTLGAIPGLPNGVKTKTDARYAAYICAVGSAEYQSRGLGTAGDTFFKIVTPFVALATTIAGVLSFGAVGATEAYKAYKGNGGSKYGGRV